VGDEAQKADSKHLDVLGLLRIVEDLVDHHGQLSANRVFLSNSFDKPSTSEVRIRDGI
jgi:hypothetical protein